MPAAKCRCDRFRILDALDQHVDAVAAPEQFAVEDHGRNAEYAERFGFIDDEVMFRSRRTMDISLAEPPTEAITPEISDSSSISRSWLQKRRNTVS